jgi:hypothetical protein
MRTTTILAALAAHAALLVASVSVRAEGDEVAPFGDRAENVVVVDHLAGFVHTARVYSDLGGDASSANLWGVMGVPPIARVGYHRFVARHVTVGLGVHYSDQTAAIAQRSATVRTWGLSPRVGFAIPLHRFLAVWLRGGVTYLNSSAPGSTNFIDPSKSTQDESEWHVALGAEAQVVFTPVENVGFTLGPTIEWGVAGIFTEGSQTQQIRWRLYGITLGLLVDF